MTNMSLNQILRNHSNERYVVVARCTNNFYFRIVEYFALYKNSELAHWHLTKLNPDQMISLVEAGASVETGAYDYETRQCCLAGVHIVQTNEGEYPRSDMDDISANNLAELPEMNDKQFERVLNFFNAQTINQFMVCVFICSLQQQVRYERDKFVNILRCLAS